VNHAPDSPGPRPLDPTTCLRCGLLAPGNLRVAIWEEEEKGRLGARPVSLCAACHAEFMAGTLTRTEVGRLYHAAKDVHPRGWIGRLERDVLLDTVCLECGVILTALEHDGAVSAAAPETVVCPSCGTTNRVRPRAGRRLTAEIVA
jgi:hypothetical protein